MRDIATNARTAIRAEHKREMTRNEEEMRRLLEGMAIRQTREEEAAARRFEDRERQLWAVGVLSIKLDVADGSQDIDSAIKAVEGREAEKRAAAEAATKRKQEEDAVRAASAQREASARKAEAERIAWERTRAEEDAKRARAEAERKRAAEEEEKAEREKAKASKGKVGTEWKGWAETQRKIKTEVIEVVKADRAIRTGLRTSMRLITRGLGQVVNTKEGVLRVVRMLLSCHELADVFRRTRFTNCFVNSCLTCRRPAVPSDSNPSHH